MSTHNTCRCTFGWLVAGVLAAASTVCGQPAEPAVDALRIVAPEDGSTTESFLTAILRWQYTLRADLQPIINIRLRVSEQPDLDEPIVDVDLRDHQTSYRLAVVPGTTYYWEIVPVDATPQGKQFDTSRAARAKFTAGLSRNDFAAPDEMRYRNPRAAALANGNALCRRATRAALAVVRAQELSHVAASQVGGRPRSPARAGVGWSPGGAGCILVLLGHDPATSGPSPRRPTTTRPCPTSSAIPPGLFGAARWCGIPASCCTSLATATAYPFITGLDNCYARQHENGFICRESDRENREVYVIFPVNPPLFAWAEWEQYRISGDQERLARCFCRSSSNTNGGCATSGGRTASTGRTGSTRPTTRPATASCTTLCQPVRTRPWRPCTWP